MRNQKTSSSLFILSSIVIAVAASSTCPAATLTVELDNVLIEADPHRLTGTNISLWTRRPIIENTHFQDAIRDWAPSYIRMPGGSWSNEYYWNGNGVRLNDGHGIENFDQSQQNPDGTWNIDFSSYKPGFRLHGEGRELYPYHGDIDVKTQHDWIQSLGSQSIVTVNVGSGTPELAAEWVRWANLEQGYNVRYWEVGNELNGDWELGHRLPDGSSMNGDVYAQYFLRWAGAMRAIDPDIKLGGPACSDLALDFVEETIRDAGEQLDFVTIHAYPVGVNEQDSAKKFAAVEQLYDAVARIENWIERYQPERADDIEIAVTEWNIKVNEDRDTADLISALWSAIWVGAMYETGVDFANQWDLSTYTDEGGHSAFAIDESDMTVKPKSQYWALWMWANLMGDQLLQHEIVDDQELYTYVTRSETSVQIMLINTSEENEKSIQIEIPQIHQDGIHHSFSAANYFWDPHAKEVLWSEKPTQQTIPSGHAVSLPKFSINILEFPLTDRSPYDSVTPSVALKNPALEILLPERVPADRPVECIVVGLDREAELPWLSVTEPINIHIEGPAETSAKTISLSNAAAHFDLIPTGPGSVTVHIEMDGKSTETTIEFVAISERADVYWTFDNPIEEWNARSTFELGSESSIRPNQYVAASRLHDDLPERDADILFHFEPLPCDDRSLGNASGLVGKLRAAHDLRTEDPDARINIILQSDANHWMPIGSIQLVDIIGEWQRFELKITDPQELDAMSKLYSVRFQIQSETPIDGDIYLDDLGFIIRTGL